jgi:tRNA(adenine34) deaminase
MSAALAEAELAAAKGEVPVGAVVACGGEILSRAHNLTESLRDASAHAEMLAMRRASEIKKNWRLADCVLCVTLEPCTMCIGAMRLARFSTLIFGAGDSRQGAAGSLYDLSQDERLGALPRVIRGVEEKRCAEILGEFFKKRRAQV